MGEHKVIVLHFSDKLVTPQQLNVGDVHLSLRVEPEWLCYNFDSFSILKQTHSGDVLVFEKRAGSECEQEHGDWQPEEHATKISALAPSLNHRVTSEDAR